MLAAGLTSLDSKFVFPELCGQVQGGASTRRGKEALLARQVSEFFANWNNIIPLNSYTFSFFLFRTVLRLWAEIR